jgi:hypothetical protein
MTLSIYNVPAEIEKKILTAIDLKKQLEQYEREIKDELLVAMADNDIKSIKNDRYTITRATRTTFSGNVDEVSPDYIKRVVDTTKVGTYAKLYGELPAGIRKSESEYITWRAK